MNVTLRALEPLIAGAMAEGIFPGAVVHIRRAGEIVAHRAYGWAAVVPRRRAMRPDSVFDLASLTKPLATATAVLQLWERGAVDIDRPVAEYLPAFAAHGKEAVTVRHLLTHTAGLPAWIRLYLHTRSSAEAIGLICDQRPAAPPDTAVEYSDLGFLLLGEIVRLRSGLSLDRYVAMHIGPALRWERTQFRPPPAWRDFTVATEVGNGYERAAAGSDGEGFPWRTEVLVGEVHDGNSHYLFDGVAGHAGLFGTAEEVGRVGQALLDGGRGAGGRLLNQTTATEATRDQTGERLGDGRGLGWKCRRGSTSMGEQASEAAFGHTGFTGTSILVDPTRALVVVLLTNRVHPQAAPASAGIDGFRRTFHDAVIAMLQ